MSFNTFVKFFSSLLIKFTKSMPFLFKHIPSHLKHLLCNFYDLLANLDCFNIKTLKMLFQKAAQCAQSSHSTPSLYNILFHQGQTYNHQLMAIEISIPMWKFFLSCKRLLENVFTGLEGSVGTWVTLNCD